MQNKDGRMARASIVVPICIGNITHALANKVRPLWALRAFRAGMLASTAASYALAAGCVCSLFVQHKLCPDALLRHVAPLELVPCGLLLIMDTGTDSIPDNIQTEVQMMLMCTQAPAQGGASHAWKMYVRHPANQDLSHIISKVRSHAGRR